MGNKHHILIKSIFHLIFIQAGILLLVVMLNQVQDANSRRRQKLAGDRVLNKILQTLRSNESSADDLSEIYHESNRAALENLRYLFSAGIFDSVLHTGSVQRSSTFQEIRSLADAQNVYLIDVYGSVVMASDPSLIGLNLVSAGAITESALQKLTAAEEGSPAAGPVSANIDGSDFYFYSAPLSKGTQNYFLILSENSSDLVSQIYEMTDIHKTIQQTARRGNSFLFAVSLTNNTFICYEDKYGNDFTGESIAKHMLTDDVFSSGFNGDILIDGRSYYCVSRTYGENIVLVSAIPSEDVCAGNKSIVFWSVLLFVMVCLLTLFYANYVRLSFMQKKHPFNTFVILKQKDNVWLYNRTIAGRVIPVVCCGVILIFGVCYYVQTLLSLSTAVTESTAALNDVQLTIDDKKDFQETVRKYYENQYLAKARIISYILEVDPSALNNENGETRNYTFYNDQNLLESTRDSEGNVLLSAVRSRILQSLCDSNSVDAIYIFDNQGRTIATNTDNWFFILSMDPGAQSYPFRQILEGKKDDFIQAKQIDDQGTNTQYIGTVFTYYTTTDPARGTMYVSLDDYNRYVSGEWEGNPVTAHNSLIQIDIRSEIIDRAVKTSTDNYIFRNMKVGEKGFLTAYDDTEKHLLLYSPKISLIGKSADELGISEKAFSGNYNGFITVSGTAYFTCFRYYLGYYIASMIPLDEMFQSCLPVAFITSIISLSILLLVSCLAIISTENEEKIFLQLIQKHEKEPWHDKPVTEGQRRLQLLSRRVIGNPPWNERTPEQKLVTLLGFCAIVFSVYVLFVLIFSEKQSGTESIISYILSDEWDKAPNIFAFSKCVIIIIAISVLIRLVSQFLRDFTSLLGSKSETIGQLLISLLRYGGWIVTIFYCLYLIGFDSSTLLTSAGIFSLVIGLGAQSLIGDILAGIFIVFEGEFHVGDFITIDNFRGEVLEIGLRTTKIIDIEQNIKVFNNSTISGVLNMAQETSYAICDVGVEYDAPIEDIEALLARELPKLREKLPNMIGVPEYGGVLRLADSSVVLRIIARCKERDRIILGRALNREILILFQKNGINIPFPQVTVSSRPEDAGK